MMRVSDSDVDLKINIAVHVLFLFNTLLANMLMPQNVELIPPPWQLELINFKSCAIQMQNIL